MTPQVKAIPSEVLLLRIIKNDIVAHTESDIDPFLFYSNRAPVFIEHMAPRRQTLVPAPLAAEVAT